MAREVALGIGQQGYIAGYQAGVEDECKQVSTPSVRMLDLLLATLLQAGADKLCVPRGGEIHNQIGSAVFAGRLVTMKDPVPSEVRSLLDELFPMGRNDRLGHGAAVWMFLWELLASIKHKRDFAIVSGIPTVADLPATMDPRFAIPLRNLLLSFETIKPSIVVPKVAIAKESVKLYEELLATEAFAAYQRKHELLSDGEAPTETAAVEITSTARTLVRANPRVAVIGKGVLKLLPATGALVETCFGKLPGKLAELAADFFTKRAEERRRCIIYDLSDHLRAIGAMHLRHLRTVRQSLGGRRIGRG